MPSVELDKLWLPSESHELAAFSKLRDLTECFPGASKVVIHIETGDGQLIANNALSTLNLKGRVIEEITFSTLWYGYDKTNRLLKIKGDASPEEFQALFVAYDLIAGHIRATRYKVYEEARLSRLEKYHAKLDAIAASGIAATAEDPARPVVAIIPVRPID